MASTARGCKAVNAGGGVRTELLQDGMSRAPCVKFESVRDAAEMYRWINGAGCKVVKNAFDSTSRYARLQSISAKLAGRLVYIRFVASTGDAMGMNMLSKGCE